MVCLFCAYRTEPPQRSCEGGASHRQYAGHPKLLRRVPERERARVDGSVEAPPAVGNGAEMTAGDRGTVDRNQDLYHRTHGQEQEQEHERW